MCGISGAWGLGKLDFATLRRFNDALAHRGPDSGGIWIDREIDAALGHRRLSILDLSPAGNQPMAYAGGRYRIAFNGEIYNFIELRGELMAKGHTFASTSDTEVLLAAYAEWGEAMLDRLNGMWAFALIDRQERSLLIARDRFGVKPLYFLQRGAQIVFASELKAFLQLEGFDAKLDRDYAATFLREPMSVESLETTALCEVKRLRPGCLIRVRNRVAEVRQWWSTRDHLPAVPRTFEDQAERFRELFVDAVRIRMRSDVALGTCLSGGFDSTSIACTLRDLAEEHAERSPPNWRQAFVASFPGQANDETATARMVADFAGAVPNVFEVGSRHAVEEIEQVLYDFDDLYIGLPTASWLVYREMRRARVLVSLDGHGADELMGGYRGPEHLIFGYAPSLAGHPWRNLELLREYRGYGPRDGLLAWSRRAAGAVARYHPSLEPVRALRRGVVRGRRREERLLRPHALREVPTAAGGEFAGRYAEGDQLNRELYTMFHATVLPAILRNFDRLSMAHGIEVRMPFLDWRLVTLVMALPSASKITADASKRVARAAMKGRIPETVRASKVKVGYNSPMPSWMSGPLRDWAVELARSAGEHDLVDSALLREMLEERDAPWDWERTARVWPAVNLLWYEQRYLSHRASKNHAYPPSELVV